MVGVFMEPIPHDCSMWFIIMRNQTYSREASYSAIISKWFVDVATSVCLDDFHEIVVPPWRKTNPVCDLALWGSERIDTRPRGGGGWIGLFKNFLKNLAENRQVRMIRPYVGSSGPSQARMILRRVGWSDREIESCTRFKIYLAFDESLWIQSWQMK